MYSCCYIDVCEGVSTMPVHFLYEQLWMSILYDNINWLYNIREYKISLYLTSNHKNSNKNNEQIPQKHLKQPRNSLVLTRHLINSHFEVNASTYNSKGLSIRFQFYCSVSSIN